MPKVIHCNKVDPDSDCDFVIRGKTDDEVLKKAKKHAKEHGITEVTPELVEKLKTSIEDE